MTAVSTGTRTATQQQRSSFKRGRKSLFLALHRAAVHLGFFVLPAHYYTPVPNVIELEATRGLWAHKSEMPGIDSDLEGQVARLEEACLPYQAEYAGAASYIEATLAASGPGYGYIESQALHGALRYLKPRRIVEVGSGVSTFCMRHALSLNEAEGAPQTQLTCIEPYPSDRLRDMKDVQLIPRPVQQVSLDVFTSLQAGDFLFIDSTHAVKAGGDVNFLMLEVLPRLAPGVVVHVHDIYLPYDYQRDLFNTAYFWSETSLLRAFLTHNDHARILFCMSQLHYERPDVLRRVFPDYVPQPANDGLAEPEVPGHFPSAIYIEIT